MTKNNKRIATLFLALILAVLAAGCTDSNDDFIQGTWSYTSLHLAQIVSENDSTTIWFFSGGTFTYQSCCFNEDVEYGGRYRILDSSEDQITIELYNFYGTAFNGTVEVLIKIDRENNELNIQGTGPYIKLGP